LHYDIFVGSNDVPLRDQNVVMQDLTPSRKMS
jgi:hypothetical protein